MEQQSDISTDYYSERLAQLQQEHDRPTAARLLLQETIEQARANIEANPFQFEE